MMPVILLNTDTDVDAYDDADDDDGVLTSTQPPTLCGTGNE